MDFRNGEELLSLCKRERLTIAQAMLKREIEKNTEEVEAGKREAEKPRSGAEREKEERRIREVKKVEEKMKRALEIMHLSAKEPLEKTVQSMGGLIGGEAEKLEKGRQAGLDICGEVITKAITYAMAVLEVNASMGVIVAAPTAGSSGVLPGVLFALQEKYELSDEVLIHGLYTAGAVGYLLMRNASVSGAQAGCQAEVGSASAMAAAAAVEMLGGTPEQALSAAAGAISNLLGLVCDPVGGLVENPCQNRNAAGAVNALINAQQALAGIRQKIPFDEMLQVMADVGRSMPFELKESALGGCAAAPSACSSCTGLK